MPVDRARHPLLVVVLCLVVLLPALSNSPVGAAPVPEGEAASLRAQATEQPLIAFLRQGNLWLMNDDGSDARLITDVPEGVTHYSWSPSGRYLAIRFESRLTLYDVASGELRDLLSITGEYPNLRSSYGSVFSWAVDADELMVMVDENNGTNRFVRVALDGTSRDVSIFTRMPACGGMDGPVPITDRLLVEQELGSSFVRTAYEGVIWWTDRDIAYVNTPCIPNIAIDLASGQVTEYPETAWLATGPDGAILIQDSISTRATSAAVFDIVSGNVVPLATGDASPNSLRSFAWTPGGEIIYATTTQGSESAFSSVFDDYPIGYSDNTVDFWATQDAASQPRHLTSLHAWDTGIPTIGNDGTIIVGMVDNPTTLMDVDQSQYSEYSPEIFAEHQKVVRIDPETGEVTVLASSAYRPRLQPASIAVEETSAPTTQEGPTDLIGTPTEVVEAPQALATEAPASSTLPPGSDRIAYVGEDGNIWLMQPDGSSQTQLTTDGTPEYPYWQPTWSHDATMLVFSRQATFATAEPTPLYLFRGGVIERVPIVHGCQAAAFLPGDQQLVLGCGADTDDTGSSAETLRSDPSRGFVSVANLDGSDWRVVMPLLADFSGWPTAGRAWVYAISVAADGTILLNWGGPNGEELALMQPGAGTATRLASPLEIGNVNGRFISGSDDILINACKGCYKHSREAPQQTLAWMDRSGAITATLLTPDPSARLGTPTMSPDGGTLVYTINGQGYPSYGTIQRRDLATGDELTIARGMQPAWQPDPGVTPSAPPAVVGQDAPADAAPSASSASSDATTVPDAFLGAWSGTGYQVEPVVDWPVTVTITGGAVGEVVGTSDYPEDDCSGNLVLREVTATGIVATEQLTSGQDFCADNGTITLGPVEGASLGFAWEGIGSTGNPSSASGTLTHADGASGAPSGGATSSSGSQDGPVIDTSRLHEYYLGTFSGTGKQTDPANTWPITVTFIGGGPGEVVGTVEYPTLGCGGELVLDSINPNDEWLGFRATERITYGHDSCIDGGTFVFSSESAVGITFIWTSPTGPTRASGSLPRVDQGAPSAPVSDLGEQPTEPGPDATSSGGPPSIYDPPAGDPDDQEIVIEPEG